MSKTAERTLTLMDQVARADEPCGLVELASRAELDKSTAARLLGYLEERGLLTRDAASKRYSVGPALVSFAAVVIRGSDLPHLAQPHLVSLRDASGETVSLHVRTGDERVCVGGAESSQPLRRVLTIGEPVPLWSGPSGKAIFAFLSDDERAALRRRARAAGVSADPLDTHLSEARKTGWLITVADRTPGVAALSVPVFDQHGVVGSLTAAGPAERWTGERMASFAPALLAAARTLSSEVGAEAA
jgi:DNA-binding IclR family transcriptional regulator